MAKEDGSYIVKLHNIRKSTDVKDILELFSNCKIKNGENGIHIVVKHRNGSLADAYIELETAADVSEALKKDNHFIGASTLKARVTASNKASMEDDLNEDGPKMKGSCVAVRDFPLYTRRKDIVDIFAGLDVNTFDVVFRKNPQTKNIECLVQFKTVEMANEALKKDRSYLFNNCIRVVPCNRRHFIDAKKFLKQMKAKKMSPLQGNERASALRYLTVKKKNVNANRPLGVATNRSYHTDVKYYYSEPEILTDKNFVQSKVLPVGMGIKYDGFNRILNNIGRSYYSNFSLFTCSANSRRNFHFYTYNSVSSPISSRNSSLSHSVDETATKLRSSNVIPMRLFGGLDFPSIYSFRPEKALARLFRMALKL